MWGKRNSRKRVRKEGVGVFANVRDFLFAAVFLSLGFLGLAFTREILMYLPEFLR